MLATWVERYASKPKVLGSIPNFDAFSQVFQNSMSMEFSKLKLALSDLAEMRVRRCYKLSREGHKSSEVTRQPSSLTSECNRYSTAKVGYAQYQNKSGANKPLIV